MFSIGLFKTKQAKEKSKDAEFEAFYLEAQPKLLRYVTGILNGDAELAADVVDEAFIAFWQNTDAPEIENKFAWLRRVARNKAIDAIRKNREKLGISDSADSEAIELADEGLNTEEHYQNAENSAKLKEIVGELSPDHREVIWLCYFEEKSVSEIAELSGVPPNTIKTRLFHARKILRGHVDKAGITL